MRIFSSCLLSFAAVLSFAAAVVAPVSAAEEPLAAGKFVNPIGEGADPWVVENPEGGYLWCHSAGNRAIALRSGPRLTALGPQRIVWRAPRGGPMSRQVWAPELHLLDGKWHIYFAASDGRNENHLAYVLVSENDDPFSRYTAHGPLETGDETGKPLWAIDMTVLEHGGRRYAVWSGWDEPGSDRQFLYIAPMKSPVELDGLRVRVCGNADHPWEWTDGPGRGRGLAEGPQVLQTGRRTFLIYSCGASWLPTYKLGRLELTGKDPMDPAAWKKHDRPVFRSTEQTFGVGHSCFVRSPDRSQWWHVFHAKRDREPGWRRSIFVQPMEIDAGGVPQFGRPVAPGLPLDLPAGEKVAPPAPKPFASSLKKGEVNPADWRVIAHHQLIDWAADGLHLGCLPEDPINVFRSGEKVLLERTPPADCRIEVTIDFRGERGARDAGILFRASGPAVGFDGQRGYFAGLIPASGLVVLGKMDGENWRELARAGVELDPSVPQNLRVECEKAAIVVFHNGRPVLKCADSSYSAGQAGLRVVDTHAVFRDLSIR